MTPADMLRAAAALVREHADAKGLTPAPWTSLDGGDRIVCLLDDQDHEYVVYEPAGAANAAWIALMHPGVGTALSDWLEDAADGDEHGEYNPYALATARAILGEVAE